MCGLATGRNGSSLAKSSRMRTTRPEPARTGACSGLVVRILVEAGTSAHWSMFEMAYGAQDGEYVALSADNSMADIDTGYSEEKKFMDALGENGVKQFRELFA